MLPPTPAPTTDSERLFVIETLLIKEFGEEGSIPEMKRDIKAIRKDLDEDVKDLAQLKHTGKGALLGVGMIFTALGVTLSNWIKSAIAIVFG